MNQLMDTLHRECKEHWILSDSNEPGEGEHKIFSYLKQTNYKNVVVYGLDADLIMLSLLSCSHKQIYLLRERTEYNIEKIQADYLYLDVNILYDCILSDCKPKEYYLTTKHLLYDYIFLCFFIGNDFIQKTPSINIRYNGLQELLKLYHQIQIDQKGSFSFVDDQYNLSFGSLCCWFERLSATEDMRMNHICKIRDKQELYWKRKEENQDHKPILDRTIEKEIIKHSDWDTYYVLYMMYHTVHKNPSHDERLKIIIDDVCRSYIESLQWTFHYYKNYSPMYWRWYQPYTFAPSMKQVFQWLKKYKEFPWLKLDNDFSAVARRTIAYVLPDSSLPVCLSLESVLKYRKPYQHPTKAFDCYLFKRYTWESIPKLPIE